MEAKKKKRHSYSNEKMKEKNASANKKFLTNISKYIYYFFASFEIKTSQMNRDVFIFFFNAN